MRHACKDCGLTYRNPNNLDEHKRVGCRALSSNGPTWSPEEAETEVELEVDQEASPEPEPQEKESSQWQELM